MLELLLPEIDLADVRLQYDDQRCNGNAAASSVPEDDWRRLEAPFMPGSESSIASWLDAPSANCYLDTEWKLMLHRSVKTIVHMQQWFLR